MCIFVFKKRLLELESELSGKRSLLNTAEDEAREMSQRIAFNVERKAGLCIRLLNKALVMHVLSFLGSQSGAYATCKYWKLVIDEYEGHRFAISNEE